MYECISFFFPRNQFRSLDLKYKYKCEMFRFSQILLVSHVITSLAIKEIGAFGWIRLGLQWVKLKTYFPYQWTKIRMKKTVKQKSGPPENKPPWQPVPYLRHCYSFVVILWVHHFYFVLGMLLRIVITVVNCLQPQLAPGHLACNSIQFTKCISANIPLLLLCNPGFPQRLFRSWCCLHNSKVNSP